MATKVKLRNIVGEGLLNRIQNSYLTYMESSAAIYEVTGDYAVAIFSSKYCDYLNQASRKIAGKTDDEALKSGKWICHEDCWATSLQSIKEKKPCEIECSGGINIYAAPIIAEGTVIGSNNIGASNPPTEEKKIGEIAQKYKVDPKELLKMAKEYSPRPEYVLEAVKKHVLVAADTIAEFFLRIKTEEALQIELKFSESLIRTAQVIVLLLDTKGRIKDFNPFMEEISGYRLKEVQGKDWFKTFLPEHDRDRIRNLFLKAIDDIQTRGNVNPIVTKDGRKLSIEWYDRTVKDVNGNTMGLLAIGMDITERKKAKEELQKAKDTLEDMVNERTAKLEATVELLQEGITERKRAENQILEQRNLFETILNSSPELIVLKDRKSVYQSVNSSFCEFIGRPESEVIGKTDYDLFPAEEAEIYVSNDTKVIGTGQPQIKDEEVTGKEGIKWLQVAKTPVRNIKGDITGVLCSVRDVTERKKVEEQVKASLKEKEVLLQEIHHRVKNNMMVITSLLKLQSNYIEEEDYKEIFNSSINRINSMALIHEKLYKSKDLAKVDFNDYLKDMINSMFMSYGLSSHKVALKIDVEDVAFGVDTAIPCGLIINELVSNSLKYAFPEAREGEIKVSLRRNDKAEVELTVSDNGVGMPEDVDFRKTDSLGLNLVNTLVGQLQGKIELYREKGTEFIITFKGITV